MTDFYSVLRRSIESRDLHSADERRQVYDQARKAMIRKLWSNDPPLAEDEIASRIGFFDAAVERIEGDLEPPEAVGPAAIAVREPPKTAAVYEGYDEEADYAPAVARPAAQREATATKERPAMEAAPTREALAPPEPAKPTRQSRRKLPEPDPEPEPQPVHVEEAAIAEDEEPLPSLFRQRLPPIERARAPAPAERLWRDDHSDMGFDGGDEGESVAEDVAAGEEARPRRVLGERDLVRLLAGVIACLAVFLIGFTIYIVYPRSSGPAVAESGIAVSRVVSDAATAAEIPKQAVKVAQSFDLFDGRDPQVFYSTPDNPIRFDKDKDGGFTRVSSTAVAAGARAVIGPGLAARLAGKTIRVTMLARSSKEGGADNLRFAYQSGVAVSHWQVAKVTPTYGEIGLIWRVPVQRTDPKGDALLIEPGIPGDGSGVDIKSIRIDLIAQS